MKVTFILYLSVFFSVHLFAQTNMGGGSSNLPSLGSGLGSTPTTQQGPENNWGNTPATPLLNDSTLNRGNEFPSSNMEQRMQDSTEREPILSPGAINSGGSGTGSGALNTYPSLED